jgi:two-component system cell cycle response regulator
MRPCILIVDDNRITTKLMRRYLEAHNFDVMDASDGIDCLEQCRLRLPCAIIMDVMMPRMDGFEATKALKADPATAHIPVMIVSGMGDLQSQQRAIDAGADDFMVKPINEALLVNKARILSSYCALQRQIAVLQFALDHALMTDVVQQPLLAATSSFRNR